MSLMQMSLAGAVMILVIIVIRTLTINLLPKKTFLALWGIAVLRLLLPFAVPSAFSVYSLAGRYISAADPAVYLQAVGMPSIDRKGQIAAVSGGSPNTAFFVSIWMIWVAGMLVCGLFFTVAYRKCLQKFQTSLPADNDFIRGWLNNHRLKRTISVRQSGRISAPLTYGIFRPVILVPACAEWENANVMKYVLAHEFVHIRRFDGITKLVLTGVLCVHWFNPLVWVMYFLANRDLELSCDEEVVRFFGESARADYARTLIGIEEIRSGFMPLCNNFKSNAMEERIIAIMKYKKTCILSLIAAFFLIFGVTAVFATSGRQEDDYSMTDEAGNIAAIEGQPMTAPRCYVDEEGNYVYQPDSTPNALTDTPGLSAPSAGAEESDAGGFKLIVTSESNENEEQFEIQSIKDFHSEMLLYLQARNEAEMKQIIADIESGKVSVYQMSDFAEGKVPGFEAEDGAEASAEFTACPDSD